MYCFIELILKSVLNDDRGYSVQAVEMEIYFNYKKLPKKIIKLNQVNLIRLTNE